VAPGVPSRLLSHRQRSAHTQIRWCRRRMRSYLDCRLKSRSSPLSTRGKSTNCSRSRHREHRQSRLRCPRKVCRRRKSADRMLRRLREIQMPISISDFSRRRDRAQPTKRVGNGCCGDRLPSLPRREGLEEDRGRGRKLRSFWLMRKGRAGRGTLPWPLFRLWKAACLPISSDQTAVRPGCRFST
jgi:hypothetical protein